MAVNRVTGFSGFDVDSTIKKMMDAEKVRLTKVQQSRQYKVWEQESYRDVIKQLNTFKSSYFDTLKSDKNMTSASSFAKFSSTVAINGTATSKVSVTGGQGLTNFDQSIEYITQLASKDTYTSSNMNLAALKSKTLDFGAKPGTFEMTMSINSVSKSISIDMTSINNVTDFKNALQSQITTQFGSSYSNVVSVDGGGVVLKSASNKITLLNKTGSESSMTWLGVTSGDNTSSYLGKSLASLFNFTAGDLSTMTINGKSLTSIGITETNTLSQMISKINSSALGVNASYDSLKDTMQFTSTLEGTENSMTLSTNLLNGFRLNSGVHTAAKNAILSMNGVEITKSSNTFNVDGLQVSLKNTHNAADGKIDLSIKVDTAAIVSQVKEFVNAYNKLIGDIDAKLSEKYYRSFTPLTDEQKEAMSDKEVELWEAKSKSGILRKSTQLDGMLNSMRQALMDKVEGSGLTLDQLGIDTSPNYKERGKLIITDEQELSKTIENNYSDVVALFTGSSDKEYLDSANKAERYKESGLANRLLDIVNDAVRTKVDSRGSRGYLLMYAGQENTATASENSLSKNIAEYDTRINTLMEYLADRESYYYSMFSRMETAMSKMNAQSSLFGGSN